MAKPFFELSDNERHKREDNNPFESAKQCFKTLRVRAIAIHGAVVSYWARLAVDGWGAFAICLRCVNSRVAVVRFHVEISAKDFQKTA